MIGEYEELAENVRLENARDSSGRTLYSTLRECPYDTNERVLLAGGFASIPVETIKGVLSESAKPHPEAVMQKALDFDVTTLDPTQRVVPHLVRQSLVTKEPLRLLLLGTAGTGKTQSIGAALNVIATEWRTQNRITTRGSIGPTAVCSWTGVAAANVGYGGQTLCSLFKINGGTLPEGPDFDAVCDALADLQLLVIDEVRAFPFPLNRSVCVSSHFFIFSN